MSRLVDNIREFYGSFASGASSLEHAFLLVIRLYWGWQLTTAGWNKLTNISGTADYFEGLGILWPTLSAILSGLAECGGGLFLILGLAVRFAALVLIFNLIVAYAMAHREAALALFSHPHDFVSAPPFLYLLVCVIVFIRGAGWISLDALLGRYLARERHEAATTCGPVARPITRREVIGLSAMAIGGLIVGAGVAHLWKEDGSAAGGRAGAGASRSPKTAAKNGQGKACLSNVGLQQVAAIQKIDKQAPEGVIPSLLLSEPHVCCGLNTCQGNAKNGENACAGQGSCATAKSHPCQGLNACKGQGGCGEYPGQNACEGKGACAVPLEQKQWEIARPKFEKLAALADCEVGKAPSNCPP